MSAMRVMVGKMSYDIPAASMEAMLEAYDAMDPKPRGDRFMRMTEIISMDRAARDSDAELREGEPHDPYKPTRYKKCLRAMLRRRQNRRTT